MLSITTTGAPLRDGDSLLDGDCRARTLKGSLRLVGCLFVDLLQNRLGCTLDEILGLLETETCQGTHLLDDGDLIVAASLEDDIKLILLSGAAGIPATRRSSCRKGNRGSSGDLKGLLECLHEL